MNVRELQYDEFADEAEKIQENSCRYDSRKQEQLSKELVDEILSSPISEGDYEVIELLNVPKGEIFNPFSIVAAMQSGDVTKHLDEKGYTYKISNEHVGKQ